MAALILVGCYEDNEIEPVIDAAVPECTGSETRECVVEGGCVGTQACSDGAFGACEAPAEVCDGIDNDCNGTIDDGFEGLGESCTAGEGICADKGRIACNAAGDGVACNAQPGDGTDEVCDGIDNDCDGDVDNDVPVGVECDTGRLGACGAGATVCANGDTVCQPMAAPTDEVCDGIDNDCDGRADEGEAGGALAEPCYDGPDGTQDVGSCVAGVQICTDGAFGACTDQVTPGDEICDGIDNDCNGDIDDAEGVECVCVPGAVQPCYGGPDGTEGVGICRGGMQTCNAEGTAFGECAGQVMPRAELCDERDNDCDGAVDNAAGVGDDCSVGQGLCAASGTRICDLGSGQVVCDAEVGAPEEETCDGEDNDCDGMVDDVAGAGDPCQVGVGACLGRGVLVCGKGIAGGLVCNAAAGAPADEICDNLDNDCNGVIDDAAGVGEACEVGLGQCRSTGVTVCDAAAGAVICPATEQPADREVCSNGFDDDCDGLTDEEDDCIIPCADDEACGPDAICEDGGCLPGCRTDEDCGPNGLCEENICVPGDCRGDDDCGDGELCIDSFCAPGNCRADDDCLPGEVCSANSCILFPVECLDAPSIGFGVTVGSTVGAGDDFQGSCNPSSPDVVYALDLAGYVGPVCATTDGSDYDTKLFARASCERQETELGCDDDGGIGVDSEIQIEVDETGAFIFVDGFNGTAGNFVLTVTQGPCACREDGDCAEGETCRIGACVAPACGDGFIEGAEQCDDGNAEAGDGCSDLCEVEPGYTCDADSGDCTEVGGLFNGGIERTPGELLPENGIAPGGDAFENECGAGEVIYGAEAALGAGIVRMRALCADIEVGGARLVLDPDGGTDSVGNDAAPYDTRITCPPNHAVVGYVGYLPAGVSLLCSPVSLEDGRLTFGDPVESDVFGLGLNEAAREQCPEGSAAAAHAGRADDGAVYAFSLRCDGFADQCDGPSSCEPIGDCFVDADCEAGDACVDFSCTGDEICNDGVGNNGNDLVDCFDVAFCGDSPGCTAGACESDEDCGGNPCVNGVCGLNLGIPIAIALPGHHTATFGELDDADGTWERPSAGCIGGGPDGTKFYETRTIVNGTGAQQQVTITANWDGFDGYLHVFADPFDAAQTPEGCVVGNDDFGGGSAASRVVNVNLAPAERLVIVLSTFGNSPTGAYTVDIATQNPIEECSDTFDNDDDSLVDCDDPDCALDAACAVCGDGTLQDGEDCDDGNLDPTDGCSPDCRFEVEICDNGDDDDFDGDIDCADIDCAFDEACAEPEVCDDGVDNDLDGLVDCDDDDCVDDAACFVPPEVCDDGVDNDGDGLVDCADGDDCAADPVCAIGSCETPTVITGPDVVEGNTNGQPANQTETDPDCVTVAPGQALSPEAVIGFAPVDAGTYCLSTRGSAFDTVLYVREGDCNDPAAEIACNDDNAAIAGGTRSALEIDAAADTTYYVFVDGFAEGRSGAFTLTVTEGPCAPPPPPENCINGVDDDGDGATDCDDDECVDDPACVVLDPEICDDGVDNSGNGLVDCLDPTCVDDPACLVIDVCGDGALGDSEECDDGNIDNGDGCDALCTIEDFAAVVPVDRIDGGFAAGSSDNLFFTVYNDPTRLYAESSDGQGGCPGDVFLELFPLDDEGNRLPALATNDDGGVDFCSLLRVANLAPGDYELSSRGLGNQAVAGVVLDYRIDVDVSAGGTFDGGVEVGGYNLFTLDLDVPATVNLENTGAAGCPADLFMRLYGFDGNGDRVLVESDDDDGAGLCSLITADLEPGRYEVEVDELNRDAAVPALQLVVTIDAAVCGDGVPAAGEQCDDGNIDNGDGCDALCTIEDFAAVVPVDRIDGGFAAGSSDNLFFTVYNDPTRLYAESSDGQGGCPGDVFLELFPLDDEGNRLPALATNDDDGAGLCSLLEINNLAPGNYELSSRGLRNQAVAGVVLDYRIDVDVSAGGTFDGGVGVGGYNLFTFDLDAPATVNLENTGAAGCPGDLDMRLYGFDGNGARVQLQRDDDGGEGFCSLITADLEPGRYEVEVEDLGRNDPVPALQLVVSFEAVADPEICDDAVDNDGDGDIDCADADCAAEPACAAPTCPEIEDGFEPNNDPRSATPLAPGAYPDLARCGNDDFYAIDVCSGGTLTVDAFFVHANGDIDLALQDAVGGGLGSSTSSTDDEQLTYTNNGPAPQTVIVRVYFDDNSYDLNVAIEGCRVGDPEVCDDGVDNDGDNDIDCADADCARDPACILPCESDVEPNDDIASATPIAPGVYDCGVLAGDDDDFTVVDVCGGGTVTATISGFAGDFDIFLFDADGNELDRGFTLNPIETAEFTSDIDQPVYIHVDAANLVGGPYTLDVTVEGCGPVALGDLVFTEVMQNPAVAGDATAEWFELYNGTAGAIDIGGWTIADDDTDSFVIQGALVIPAGGYQLFVLNGDAAVNGGIEGGYDYAGMTLGNAADELVLRNPQGVEVAAVRWDNGATFPDPNGASMQFDARLPATLANTAVGANWCEAFTPYGAGDFGTPGAPNDPCGPVIEPPLPIADLGERITINGSIDQGDMLWGLPTADCQDRADGQDYPYDVYRLVNGTGAPQQLYVQGFWPQDFSGSGMIHAWAEPFDPALTDGCIVGSQDGLNGRDDRLPLVDIAPGEVLVIVVSSTTPDPGAGPQPIGRVAVPYFGAYVVDVNTLDIQPDPVDFCRLQFPDTIEGFEGAAATVYGRYYEAGITDETGHHPDFSPLTRADLGILPDGADPADPGAWTWIPAAPNPRQGVQAGEQDNDEYQADVTLPAPGLYSYAYRFSVDDGMSYQLCDLDGAGANLDPRDPAGTFSIDQAGLMLVEADPCIEGCADAAGCGFLAFIGVASEQACVDRCQAGEITREQAQCVADANNPPACDAIATIACGGLAP